MPTWHATYYIVNRYGQTQERTRSLGVARNVQEIHVRMNTFLRQLAERGQAPLMTYDLEERSA